MAELPTNYLDDILAASMGGKRIFKITHSDGTTEEVTIEDVSEYEQVGSNFGAGDINNTNAEVNKKFDSGDVVDPMETTEPGFAADAYQTKLQFDEQNKNLDSCFRSVSSGKSSVASAITAKGVATASDATFATIAANVSEIPIGVKEVGVIVNANNTLAWGKVFNSKIFAANKGEYLEVSGSGAVINMKVLKDCTVSEDGGTKKTVTAGTNWSWSCYGYTRQKTIVVF